MHILNFQWTQDVVNVNYDKDLQLMVSVDRVDVYVAKLLKKFNSPKCLKFWPSMLIEIISIANTLNISLVEAFSLKGYEVADVAYIKPDYISIPRLAVLDKEMFESILSLKQALVERKEGTGSNDDIPKLLAIMIMLVVQGSTSIQDYSYDALVNDKPPAIKTFVTYLDCLLEVMSNDFLHDYKHISLMGKDKVYNDIWTWRARNSLFPRQSSRGYETSSIQRRRDADGFLISNDSDFDGWDNGKEHPLEDSYSGSSEDSFDVDFFHDEDVRDRLSATLKNTKAAQTIIDRFRSDKQEVIKNQMGKAVGVTPEVVETPAQQDARRILDLVIRF